MPDRHSSDFPDDSASAPNPEPSTETTRPVTPNRPPPEPRFGVGGSGSTEPGGESPLPPPEPGARPSPWFADDNHTEVVNLAELRSRTGAGPGRQMPPGSPRRWDSRPPGAHSGPPSPPHAGPPASSPSPQQPEAAPPAHQSGPPSGPQP